MIYGLEAILPIELEVQSLRIALDERMGDYDSLKHRLVMLEKLDETRVQIHLNMEAIQKHRKSYYDSKLAPKKLEPNDLVLLYDSRFQNSQENLKCDGLVHIEYSDPFLMDLWNYKILQANSSYKI